MTTTGIGGHLVNAVLLWNGLVLSGLAIKSGEVLDMASSLVVFTAAYLCVMQDVASISRAYPK